MLPEHESISELIQLRINQGIILLKAFVVSHKESLSKKQHVETLLINS